MRNKIVGLTALFFIFMASLTAVPAQVILLRHAEIQANDLSLRGKERAAALAEFFQGAPEFQKFGRPAALFAQGVQNYTSPLRSINTLEPLSYALNITIYTEYVHDQYAALAQFILTNPAFNNKLVIVAWAHDVLPELAKSLGVAPMPKKWPQDIFDRLWILTYKSDGKIEFADVPQRLLFGDSPT